MTYLFMESGLTLAQLCNTQFCQAFHHTPKMLTATPPQYLWSTLTTHRFQTGRVEIGNVPSGFVTEKLSVLFGCFFGRTPGRHGILKLQKFKKMISLLL